MGVSVVKVPHRNVEEAQDEKKMYYGYEGFLSFVERISSEEFLSL